MSLSRVVVIAAALCTALSVSPASGAKEKDGPVTIEINKEQKHFASCWLESSLKRVYPTSPVGDRARMRLLSARNARVSFQACVSNNSLSPQGVRCTVEAPAGIKATVRRVGYVPMRGFTWGTPKEELDGIGHLPGLVPDPLHPDAYSQVHAFGNQPFWITVDVPSDAAVGVRELVVRLAIDGIATPAELKVDLDVRPLVVKPRRDFPVTHWWNADAVFDYYKVEAFGDEWLKLADAYLANMVSHGSNVIFVPLLHHRREVVQRPAQLLIVNVKSPGVYEFDWSRARRFVRMAKKIGFEHFEWPHFWQMKITPEGATVGAAEPARVYTLKDGKYRLIFAGDSPALSAEYVTFLGQFLPELHKFIKEEGLEKTSYYHASDEPGGSEEDLANYKAVRAKLRELAPWTDGKVMDAMSDVRYADLMDIPVPNVAAAADYIARGIPHWVYYCCGPVGPYTNRFYDTPLIKTRMAGALFYKLRAQGFLHWGYNYWYVMDLGHNPTPQDLVDPWNGSSVMPYGDAHVVYPGPGGPVDSIRWEVFAEGLQDYAILQSAGIKPDDPMLAELIDYGHFPKSEEWLNKVLGTAMK